MENPPILKSGKPSINAISMGHGFHLYHGYVRNNQRLHLPPSVLTWNRWRWCYFLGILGANPSSPPVMFEASWSQIYMGYKSIRFYKYGMVLACINPGWWFGTWFFWLSINWEESAQLTNIFQRGSNHQPEPIKQLRSVGWSSKSHVIIHYNPL